MNCLKERKRTKKLPTYLPTYLSTHLPTYLPFLYIIDIKLVSAGSFGGGDDSGWIGQVGPSDDFNGTDIWELPDLACVWGEE